MSVWRILSAAAMASMVAPGLIAQVAEPVLPASPEVVAIVDEGAAGFSVRHFPSRLRLYTFDKDAVGRSACVESCAAIWPPLRDRGTTRPVGDWSLIPRADGDPQWAYRGAPVYVRYHDDPDAPGGEGADGGAWHLIKNIPRAGSQPASTAPR